MRIPGIYLIVTSFKKKTYLYFLIDNYLEKKSSTVEFVSMGLFSNRKCTSSTRHIWTTR